MININSMSFTNPRNIIKEHDEGPHQNDKYLMREWWYYNVFFNDPKSDLKNWFLKCSINRAIDSDGIKLILHDNKNKSYGSTYKKPKGTTIVSGPGINTKFDKSFIKGMYPKWHVHIENTEMDDIEIIVDLNFKAKSKPIWIFKNTGHNKSTSYRGYYFVMNSDAEGSIIFKGKKHYVKGIGYYDHTWLPFAKKNKEKDKNFNFYGSVWDWLLIRLNNGWNLFIGKIYPKKRYIFPVILPGNLIIVSNSDNILETFFYPIIYKKYFKSSISTSKIPKELNIKTYKINPLNNHLTKSPIFLDLYYNATSINEYLYDENPPFGQWDSVGTVYGLIKGRGIKQKVNGYGIMEYMSFI